MIRPDDDIWGPDAGLWCWSGSLCLCPPNPRQSSVPRPSYCSPQPTLPGSPSTQAPHLSSASASDTTLLLNISRAVATPTTHITRHVSADTRERWRRRFMHFCIHMMYDEKNMLFQNQNYMYSLSDNSRWHFWKPGDVSSIFMENHLSFRNTQIILEN